jgi:hypothetical protein
MGGRWVRCGSLICRGRLGVGKTATMPVWGLASTPVGIAGGVCYFGGDRWLGWIRSAKGRLRVRVLMRDGDLDL